MISHPQALFVLSGLCSSRRGEGSVFLLKAASPGLSFHHALECFVGCRSMWVPSLRLPFNVGSYLTPIVSLSKIFILSKIMLPSQGVWDTVFLLPLP